ncbi:MAG: single-stranded-DNA-specific exonuclease RecJ [Clostridia bacterium]|nr:single-stranded-DNA-specific exonuclease RecJ [Clostridia bacterium]
MSFKRWAMAPLDKDGAAALAEECGLHPFLALMLSLRGVSDAAGAEEFLLGGELQDDPFGFADMDAAVERIQRAIDSGERIAVFGDYDADGVTATALLYTYLCEKNADVFYRVPKREGEGEGYGLRPQTVERLAEQGARLIVTVDNGVTAVEAVERATELGIDVVVTDHHQPQETLPAAVAVVDPHRADCGSTVKEYAGVGVAFKLVCALEGDVDEMLARYADLVALGTLADVMPLVGENRLLVREGLRALNRGSRVGFAALANVAGVSGKTQTSSTALFALAPRINAAGRMGDPEKAARLLLTNDCTEAAALAGEIQELNLRRQEVEAAILQEVTASLQEHPERLLDRVLVVEGHGWHAGVVGIIAARLLDRYGKPCLVLSINEENGTAVAHGSGRSLRGFSLFDALTDCADMLLSYGGHELAAGVSMEAERVEEFRRRINDYAARQFPVMPVPELRLDFKMRPDQVDVEKLQLIAALEPFGNGNPSPVFQLSDMRLENIVPVGNGRHLRLAFSRDGAMMSAMKFQTTVGEFPVPCGARLNLAVTLERNEYHGTVSTSVVVKDLRYADTDQEVLLQDTALVARLRRGEEIADATSCLPERAHQTALYRLLHACGQWVGTPEQLWHSVGGGMRHAQLLVTLESLHQANLIHVEDRGDTLSIAVQPAEGKTDLNETPIMKFIHTL